MNGEPTSVCGRKKRAHRRESGRANDLFRKGGGSVVVCEF